MPGGGRPFKDDPTSYKRTGIPCGNPQRYQSHGVIRMAPDGTPFRDQRNEAPIEDIETEGERQLKELLKRQLDTKVTLQGLLTQNKEFTEGAVFKPLQAEVVGQMTLGDYRGVVSRDRQVDELRLVGLTDDEIQLKLTHDDNDGTFTKRKRYGVDSTVYKSKLEEIDRKINAKLADLAKPDTFTGMKHLSRQEMDLERAISHDRDKAGLLGCLLTERRPNTGVLDPKHPMNHLGDIVQEVMKRKRKGKKSTAVRREVFENDDGSEEEFATIATCAEKNDSVLGCTQELSTCEESKDGLNCYKANPWVSVVSIANRMKAITDLLNPSRVVPSESPQVPIVSTEEIERARLSAEDIKSMPRFRNYEPGEPSKTLYIKNLSPRVGQGDLYSLFSRFQKSSEPDIVFKLMTGRMKGQAFVTFHDVERATEAQRLVHGYTLKGRPMIIQYGRNTTNRPEPRDSDSTSVKT